MTILGEMIWEDGYQGGEIQKVISQICKKLKRGLDIPQIAREVEEDVSYVERICETARKYAPEYDVAKIAQELKQSQ